MRRLFIFTNLHILRFPRSNRTGFNLAFVLLLRGCGAITHRLTHFISFLKSGHHLDGQVLPCFALVALYVYFWKTAPDFHRTRH